MSEEPARVYIQDVFEAGKFAGREGVVFGASVPSISGVSPVIETRKGRLNEDLAYSVYFEDTDEEEWFAPYLVKRVESHVE